MTIDINPRAVKSDGGDNSELNAKLDAIMAAMVAQGWTVNYPPVVTPPVTPSDSVFTDLVNCSVANNVVSYTTGTISAGGDSYPGFSARIKPSADKICIFVPEIGSVQLYGSVDNDWTNEALSNAGMKIGVSSNGNVIIVVGANSFNMTPMASYNGNPSYPNVGNIIEIDLLGRTVRNLSQNTEYAQDTNGNSNYPQSTEWSGKPPYLYVVHAHGNVNEIRPAHITASEPTTTFIDLVNCTETNNGTLTYMGGNLSIGSYTQAGYAARIKPNVVNLLYAVVDARTYLIYGSADADYSNEALESAGFEINIGTTVSVRSNGNMFKNMTPVGTQVGDTLEIDLEARTIKNLRTGQYRTEQDENGNTVNATYDQSPDFSGIAPYMYVACMHSNPANITPLTLRGLSKYYNDPVNGIGLPMSSFNNCNLSGNEITYTGMGNIPNINSPYVVGYGSSAELQIGDKVTFKLPPLPDVSGLVSQGTPFRQTLRLMITEYADNADGFYAEMPLGGIELSYPYDFFELRIVNRGGLVNESDWNTDFRVVMTILDNTTIKYETLDSSNNVINEFTKTGMPISGTMYLHLVSASSHEESLITSVSVGIERA